MSIKEKDAFIIQEINDIYLYTYMKLNHDELQHALPNSYENKKENEYLICIIDEDGRDYLGQGSIHDIIHNIKDDKNEIKIANIGIGDDYNQIKSIIPNLSYSLFNRYKSFVQKQVYSIE